MSPSLPPPADVLTVMLLEAGAAELLSGALLPGHAMGAVPAVDAETPAALAPQPEEPASGQQALPSPTSPACRAPSPPSCTPDSGSLLCRDLGYMLPTVFGYLSVLEK